MTQQKKDRAGRAQAGTPKGAKRSAWGRGLRPSLLRGVRGGDGVQGAADYVGEAPQTGPKG
jgi:hypothetical protein